MNVVNHLSYKNRKGGLNNEMPKLWFRESPGEKKV